MSKPARQTPDVTRLSDFAQLNGRNSPFIRDTRFVALTDMAPPTGCAVPFAALGMPRLGAGAQMDDDLPDVLIDARAQPSADPIAVARAEGYAQGAADAEAAAEQDIAEADAARAKLQLAFQHLDVTLTEDLRRKLMDTVVALCEATLAPLAIDRDALTVRVRRAAAMFVRADDERVIRLHPQDLELVRSLLPGDWHLLADAGLERGAIRVETKSGGAEDGPAQWRRAIAEALDLNHPE